MSLIALVRFLGIVLQGFHQCFQLPALTAIGAAIPALVAAFTLRQTRVFVRGDRQDARIRWFKLITLLPESNFYEYMRVDRRVFDYLVRQYQRSYPSNRKPLVFNFVFIALGLSRLGHGLSFRQIGLHFGCIYDFYVGWPGSVNDARVFQHSPARHKIELGGIYDYAIVSDAAYGLRNYIHMPYRALLCRTLPDEQRVWNLQQSRARMIVEQVNGRLKMRWRILDGRLECDIFRAPQYVSACIVLHNIDLLLGPRPRLIPPREHNTWWQHGPAAKLPHFSPRDEGFTPTRRRARMAACLYASWRLGHPELAQPTLGYDP
ncbi:unnamed protein product [Closterium sp. Yama58-4]|nr:unnamed protein product [Closterium sp. Yama58-4]